MDQARLRLAPARDFGIPAFAPRAPWWGGDLQTLRNFLVPSWTRLASFPHERLLLDLNDGTGDRLSAMLSRPSVEAPDRPLIMLIHGLSGFETSFYMRRTAAHLLGLGYRVLRLNLRGAGPSRPTCRWHYHAGRSEDIALALAAVPAHLKTNGVVAVGYSLGANMLLKLLGERGAATPLRAGVSVSAPLDLAGTARSFLRRRNAVYQAYLLRYMKAEAVAPIAEVTERERRALWAARSIWDFDDCYSAPRNGYTGATDYYERCAARNFLGAIATPTLVIHALDDPWIPAESYRNYDWAGNPNLLPLITEHGGHVGFAGGDRRTAWHDLAIGQFLANLSRL